MGLSTARLLHYNTAMRTPLSARTLRFATRAPVANRPADDARSTTPLVEATDVTVRHGRRTVLRDFSVSVAPGNIVSLLGPNGAGKTTAVRTLLGLQVPSSGTVTRREGLSVGYVPQRLSIDRTLPLTVRRLMTLTATYPRSAVDAALVRLGISTLAEAPVQSLSGGEFQRVLLARALIREPDLLVLDEPAQGLDLNGEVELYRAIREARDSTGCGVIMISHDLHMVMAETDHVICLNGHICCSGAPKHVAGTPAFRALFGDRVAETMAVYAHEHHAMVNKPATDKVVPLSDRLGGGHGVAGGSEAGRSEAGRCEARRCEARRCED